MRAAAAIFAEAARRNKAWSEAPEFVGNPHGAEFESRSSLEEGIAARLESIAESYEKSPDIEADRTIDEIKAEEEAERQSWGIR